MQGCRGSGDQHGENTQGDSVRLSGDPHFDGDSIVHGPLAWALDEEMPRTVRVHPAALE